MASRPRRTPGAPHRCRVSRPPAACREIGRPLAARGAAAAAGAIPGLRRRRRAAGPGARPAQRPAPADRLRLRRRSSGSGVPNGCRGRRALLRELSRPARRQARLPGGDRRRRRCAARSATDQRLRRGACLGHWHLALVVFAKFANDKPKPRGSVPWSKISLMPLNIARKNAYNTNRILNVAFDLKQHAISSGRSRWASR